MSYVQEYEGVTDFVKEYLAYLDLYQKGKKDAEIMLKGHAFVLSDSNFLLPSENNLEIIGDLLHRMNFHIKCFTKKMSKYYLFTIIESFDLFHLCETEVRFYYNKEIEKFEIQRIENSLKQVIYIRSLLNNIIKALKQEYDQRDDLCQFIESYKE